jgi:hypothetical protein
MWCGADAGLFLLEHFRQVLMIEPGLAGFAPTQGRGAVRRRVVTESAHNWEVSRTTLVDIKGAE